MVFQIDRRMLLGALAASAATSAFAAARQPRQFQLYAPDGRKIEISLWAPKGKRRGTIAFSHGAGSSPRFYTDLFAPWLSAGFEILAPLHVDSREHPDTAKFPVLATWKARLEDMHALSTHIGNPYLAAGHSYGGLVALTLGGSESIPPEGMALPLRDTKVKAAVAFSPPAPVPVLVTAQGYAKLAVPAFIQTGTRDIPPGPPGTSVDPESWRGHLSPFIAAAPGGSRYALVIDGVDHYFGGAICRPDVPGPPQVKELAEAGRLSTIFLRAFGGSDATALASLEKALTDEGPFRFSRR